MVPRERGTPSVSAGTLFSPFFVYCSFDVLKRPEVGLGLSFFELPICLQAVLSNGRKKILAAQEIPCVCKSTAGDSCWLELWRSNLAHIRILTRREGFLKCGAYARTSIDLPPKNTCGARNSVCLYVCLFVCLSVQAGDFTTATLSIGKECF